MAVLLSICCVCYICPNLAVDAGVIPVCTWAHTPYASGGPYLPVGTRGAFSYIICVYPCVCSNSVAVTWHTSWGHIVAVRRNRAAPHYCIGTKIVAVAWHASGGHIFCFGGFSATIEGSLWYTFGWTRTRSSNKLARAGLQAWRCRGPCRSIGRTMHENKEQSISIHTQLRRQQMKWVYIFSEMKGTCLLLYWEQGQINVILKCRGTNIWCHALCAVNSPSWSAAARPLVPGSTLSMLGRKHHTMKTH